MKVFTPWRVSFEAVRTILDLLRSRYASVFHIQDTFLMETVVAAYVANTLSGDPVWLLVIGPASSGKTATLELIRSLEHIHEIGGITEGALLSGTPKKEIDKGATGGILTEIGVFGILLCKDFTTILSMSKDQFNAVMRILREIYDGRYTRAIGVDGGRTLTWAGKVGFIAASTEIVDTKHDARQSMGERFIMLRLSSDADNSFRIAQKALQSDAAFKMGMDELRELTKTIAGYIVPNTPLPDLPQEIADRLASLSFLVTRGRSAVVRHSYSREIEDIPNPEEPARLAKQLRMMYFGYLAIGCTEEEALERVTRLALDSMPSVRRTLLDRLFDANEPVLTSKLADAIGGVSKMAIRHLEELEIYGLVFRLDHNPQLASWGLTASVREHMEGIFSPYVAADVIPFSENGLEEDRTVLEEKPPAIAPPKYIGRSRSDSTRPDEARRQNQTRAV